MARLTPAVFAAVAAEITRRRGASVMAVHQDNHLRWRIALESKAGRVDLVLDLDPAAPRLHFDEPRRAPGAPTPLAARMRRALRAARLEGARAVRGERAVVVAFVRGGHTTTLWFEGFGHSANLYLVEPDGRVTVTPRGRVAAERGAKVGDIFEPVPPRDAPATPPEAAEGASAAVARQARAADAERRLQRRRTDLLRHLRREVRQARDRLDRLELDAARGEEAERWQRRGELLQASFHLLAPGLESVRVPDHTVEPPTEVDVPLAPGLAPGEQVAACFRRARKAQRTVEQATLRAPALKSAFDEAEAALAAAEAASDLGDVEALATRVGLPEPQPAARRPAAPPRAAPWREFRSADGWRILVGKGAAGNDRLTTREARPHDLFLHVAQGSGSHVIVPTARGKTVPRDTLIDAAELACLFSGSKDVSRCEVNYTPRGFVRKPRGAPEGQVRLERAKTLTIRPDADRRSRLLATRRK